MNGRQVLLIFGCLLLLVGCILAFLFLSGTGVLVEQTDYSGSTICRYWTPFSYIDLQGSFGRRCPQTVTFTR